MAKIYALLIGINNYPSKPLQGCINDVDAFKKYLETVYPDKEQLVLKILTDQEQPTRQNFIDAFQLFDDANGEDNCLFYYSGHGSFSLAPAELASDSGFVQSFVCQDSRLPGGRDLIDKEMSYLLWKTMHGKPDVTFVAITDCCHSGSIMKAFDNEKDVTERMISADSRTSGLKLEDYLGYNETIKGEKGYVEEFQNKKKIIRVRQTKHIHLAASKDNQTSKELIIDGVNRGAFTHSLLKILYQYGGQISYKNLIDQTSVLVKNLVIDQSPGVNLNGGLPSSEQDKVFLSRQNAEQVKYLVYYNSSYGWCIKAGSIHGVSKGDRIYIKDRCQSIVIATPAPDFSVIMGKPELGKETETYYASIQHQPNQETSFSFSANINQDIKTWIKEVQSNKESEFVTFSEEPTGQYIITTNYLNEASVSLAGTDKTLFKPLKITSPESAAVFINKLEILTRWRHLVEFTNPSTELTNKHYTIKLYQSKLAGNYNPDTFEEIPLGAPVNDLLYKYGQEKWLQPAIQIAITNHLPSSLWVTNAYLGFDYSIVTDYFSPMEIGPGRTVYLELIKNSLPVDVIKLRLDNKYKELGYNEIIEYIKLFISTPDQILTAGLNQEGIDMAGNRDISTKEFSLRGAGEDEDSGEMNNLSAWKVETLAFRIIKPQPEINIANGNAVKMGSVTIVPPEKLQGRAVLSSSSQKARSADGIVPPNRAYHNSFLEPFDLTSGLRSGSNMDVLELLDVEDKNVVSKDNPLFIKLSASLNGGSVIPIGYDPETKLYYPLGFTSSNGDIIIKTLPEITSTDPAINERSLLGSIKIYLQKVIGQKIGLSYDYPRLSEASVNDKLEVHYSHDKDKIKAKVLISNKILIFVHGIIGDTEGMVKCIKSDLDGKGTTFEKRADLILTFDYENLNTKIEENSLLLKQRLEKIGLEANHGKEVIIIAHSMGGMVSRWFIEKLGGNKVISKLIMLGTPNNGTPWADVRDFAEVLLTYAINGAAFLKPWMFILSAFGKLAAGTQVAFKQMNIKNGMYPQLNDNTDPTIPYVIIAGNTQNIIVNYRDTASVISKLFLKVKSRGIYDALDVVLFKESNDIAVTDKSILDIKGAENWSKSITTFDVACDHLNYFITPEALDLVNNEI
ncbi:hypothetical protein DBR11_14415 [Pedobacter sp. HMWF019]|uniref:caspase family protein n=1 Tax=Pedobacter sp. HMWF019 TaxID=2056856 RepID=UPI000D3B7781|nr:caspase family protein [Pedobacter sp. HMWF019]PTS98634.1 hypothetical protein DBR11_14415 [Pedobacter sp. HMWF019]